MNFKEIYSSKGKCLSGLLLINPKIGHNSRGFFQENWNKKIWNAVLKSHNQFSKSFVQDNHYRSKKGTLGGLNYQLEPFSQGKLVKCMNGRIYDVAVDSRKNSETKKLFNINQVYWREELEPVIDKMKK